MFLRVLTEDMNPVHERRTGTAGAPLRYFSKPPKDRARMTKRQFLISPGSIALLLASPGAQGQTPPTAYIITEVNSMMGLPVTMKIYRDGSKALN
jgi:hypothetical protein